MFLFYVVLAQCKELGIEEEKNLAPVPKRRKAKFSSVMDEKRAINLQQTTKTTTSDSQTKLNKPVEHRSDFCQGSTSHNVSSFMSNRMISLPAIQDEPNNRFEDREEKGSLIDQTASTSTTEMRAVNKSKQFYKDTIGELNGTDRSKCNGLGRKSFQISKEGEMEVQRDLVPENSEGDFVDTNITQSNDVDTKCSWGLVETFTKEHSSLLISEKTKGTKCVASAENFSGLEQSLNPGGVIGELRGNKLDFNVPPSPGHAEPHPDKLSSLHQLIQSGKPIHKRKL